MSLRKITTLILLAAFALTQVPVQAASLTTTGTAPKVIVDAGTAANGANRDVVPVTLSIDTDVAGDVRFGTYTGNGTFAVTENGQLTIDNGATLVPATSTRVLVIQPPTGAEFVGLAGYVSDVTTLLLNPTATSTETQVNVSTSGFPTGAAGTDDAVLAKILTEDGPASTFGTVVPKGSIVVYTITNSASNVSSAESDITFNNIGLAVPAGSTLTTFNASYKEVIIGLSVNEAVPSLADGATVAVATLGTAGTSQIDVSLASETDAQSNSVLADLLANSSSTVKVNTNNTTSTTVNATTLYVDTDALLIQAAEVSTGVYYNTPFNTSSFLSAVANGNSATLLNAALTGASFPNSANALITVTYSLVPLTGNGTTDATLVVDAASVSLEDSTSASGFLGALAVTPTINGTGAITPANFAVSVLYNGASATGALPVVDFDLLNDATTNVTGTVANAVGFSFTAPADALATTSATGTPFNVANGTLQTGIFSGVTVAQADALGTTPGTVVTAGALTPFTVAATGFAGATAGEHVWVADEVTARLLPTGGNAIFAFTGNEAAASLVATKENIRIGPTNLATVPYNTAAFVQNNAADTDVKNNAILVAKLSGNAVQIMPLVNKLDSVRDVIKVRPEATITLGATSKAQGVKLIATVTGNNIVGSKVVEIARVNASGSTNANVTVSSLPAAGTLNRLLAENGTDASTLRVAVNLSSITNVTTNDEVSDLIANGSVLDDTLPSFFCGGTAGTVTKGPNAVPQQPYARAVLVQEAAAGAFAEVRVSANDRIRFTLPVGVDLVKTNATAANNDVAVISTDGGAVGTFGASAAITAYQTISEQNGGQAFIDVDLPAVVAGTTTVKNAIALIFGQYSLVIPEGQTNFDVAVTLVNDDATTSTAADITLDTLGTVPLATGCADQFTISYCEDALANFGQASGPVVSDIIANGSLLTSFSNDVSSSVRLLNTETTAFRIPDICVTEAVSDALFVSPSATTPNIFGPGTTISLAISDSSDLADNTNDVGFAGAGTIDTSDDSVSFGATGIAGGLLNSVTTAGTGTDSFLETTTIRFTGITLGKTAGNFQPSVQNITVFTNDGTDHIATSMPAAFETRGANGTALSVLSSGSGNVEEVINTFFNGDNIANNTATPDGDSGDFVNGEFLGFAFAGNSPKLTNAVKTINDSASVYSQLSDSTKLSIAVDDIAAVTNGLAAYTRITVFTSTGELEPGSIITITSPTDSVTVPVMDDGNFIAQLRGAEGDTLVIVQTPTSDQATADQTVVVEAQDQNLEPTLLSAVAQNFTSIGTVTEQGTAPVLFKLTAVGRVGADVFIPTASQLTVGGNPVYAVPGTDDMFLAIIDFKKTNGTTVTANVTGSPSVGITGLDSDFPTFAKSSRPNLVRVQQKTRKDGDTRVVFRGSKLRNSGVGYIITTTGSVQEVTFRNRTSSDAQASRVVSQGTATIPTNALFGVYHVRGRGISTIDLSN